MNAKFKTRAAEAHKRAAASPAVLPPTSGFSISGSLGSSGAGATVIVVGNSPSNENPMACSPVTADGNGNYTTPIVAPNDSTTPSYFVIPIKWEKEFSPFSQTVVVTNANVTGVNWTGSPTSYSVNVDFTDRFQRGPQTPVGGWTTFGDGDAQLNLNSSNIVVASAADPTVCGAYPSSFVPNSANCWCQVDLETWANEDVISLKLRQDANPTTHGYNLEMSVPALGTIGAVWQISDDVANAGIISGLGFVEGISPYTFNKGDGMILVARGNHIYCFQKHNGVQTPLGAAFSSTSPLVGKVGLEFLSEVPGQTGTQNFYSGHTS